MGDRETPFSRFSKLWAENRADPPLHSAHLTETFEGFTSSESDSRVYASNFLFCNEVPNRFLCHFTSLSMLIKTLFRPNFSESLLAFIASSDQTLRHCQDQTQEMEQQTQQELRPKRLFCSSCSKPAKLCLCSRFKSHSIDNSIAVTILQHSQEKNHPLNSTRIAALGLKNLTVATVSDIHFDTQFVIRLKKRSEESIFDTHLERVQKNGKRSQLDCEQGLNGLEISVNNETQKESNFGSVAGGEECVISATMSKCGPTYTAVSHLQCNQNHFRNPNFEEVLASKVGQDAVSNGFVVKKLQRKQIGGTQEFSEHEEFEILVPPGSALLYPTKKAISIEAIDFKVKNLIVLDGTWKKAKRVYHENPWLKLLPHLKLDPDKMSLYGEVRHQPKAGCLSTIESIVFALKAFGEDGEGLDDLLEVFKSMIGDQIRCKDEKFRRMKSSNSESMI